MMSPMMKMTTKSTTAMMSSVIEYCCMCNHVIYIIEIVNRNCKRLLRAKLENLAYICQNCVPLDVVNKLITLLT